MEFKFRAIDEQGSTFHPPSSSFSYFTAQALRAKQSSISYSTSNFGRAHEFFRNPSDMREAIHRELEKERIREEIIAAEISRKRVLEAEVRAEMLMEREMALRRSDGLSFLSAGRFEPRLSILHQLEGRSLEERIALSLEERLGYSVRGEIGGFEALPFQRNVKAKISECKPVSEVSKEKVILLTKPDANLSGGKRKAVTPPAAGGCELPLIDLKKLKEEWSCAICQVSATSERGLDEHLQGKKHKAKEAGLRAQRTDKNFGIGLFPKKTAKPTKLAESTNNPSSEQGHKTVGESLQVSKTMESSPQIISITESSKKIDEPLLQTIQEPYHPKKKNGEAWPKMQTVGEYKKKKFTFWCEMCQSGAYNEKVMDAHKKGKKHVFRLQELKQNGGAVPGTQMTEAAQKANNAEEVVEDGKMDAL